MSNVKHLKIGLLEGTVESDYLTTEDECSRTCSSSVGRKSF